MKYHELIDFYFAEVFGKILYAVFGFWEEL